MCCIGNYLMIVIKNISQKWKKLRKNCKKLRIVKNIIYKDQPLWEIEFSDDQVISIYQSPQIYICSCNKSTDNQYCKHLKLAFRTFEDLTFHWSPSHVEGRSGSNGSGHIIYPVPNNVVSRHNNTPLNSFKKEVPETMSLISTNSDTKSRCGHEMDYMDTECLVCFNDIMHQTKVVICGTCKTMTHKSCWKKWQLSTTFREQPSCMACCQEFKDGIKDNKGYII